MYQRIYIAGPMRGYENYNWAAFEEAARLLRLVGHEVISPTEIDEEAGVVYVERDSDGTVLSTALTPSFNFEEVIARDLEAVASCTAIYLLEGWEASTGAKMELAVALANNLEVYVD